MISGVVEEKNNRVVEVILSAVRPRHLLAGKVIGIGSLGFAQLALVAGLAAGLLVAGVFDAPAALGGDMALVIPWFVLGFALYAVAYAVAGALASSQQNADTAGQPVTYALIAVYFAGYVVLAEQSGRPARDPPHRLPADRAARAPRPQRARRRAALAARARGRSSSSSRSTRSSASPGASTRTGSCTAVPGLGLRAAWRLAREH